MPFSLHLFFPGRFFRSYKTCLPTWPPGRRKVWTSPPARNTSTTKLSYRPAWEHSIGRPPAPRPRDRPKNTTTTITPTTTNNLPISGESQYHNHVAMLATQNSHSHSHKMPSPNGVSGGVCPYASQMSSSSPRSRKHSRRNAEFLVIVDGDGIGGAPEAELRRTGAAAFSSQPSGFP